MPKGLSKLIFFSLIIHFIGFIFFNYSHEAWLVKKENQSEKTTWVKLSKGFLNKQDGNLAKKTKAIPKSTIRDKKKATNQGNTKKTNKNSSDPKPAHKNNVFKSKDTSTKKPSPPKKSPPKTEVPKKNTDNKNKAQSKPQADKPRPKTEEEILMEKALAALEKEVNNRDQTMIEEAQIDDNQGGHSPFGSDDNENLTENEKLANLVSQMKEEIQRQWILLPQKERDFVTALVAVELKSDGTIKNISFEKKSGDASFDISATRAIERAAPFVIPDDEIGRKIIEEGFLIEFQPHSVVDG